jgi:hypothetical protein
MSDAEKEEWKKSVQVCTYCLLLQICLRLKVIKI